MEAKWVLWRSNITLFNTGIYLSTLFAHMIRDWLWSKELEWDSSRPITPIAVAQKPQLWMHINVLKSVKKYTFTNITTYISA